MWRRALRGRRFVRVWDDTVLVAIGDSHAKFWSGRDAVFEPDRLPGIIACHVGPALAWSLIEEHSTTRAGQAVRAVLRDLAAQHYAGWVLLCFGEIDLRAHVLKHEGDLSPNLAELAQRYLAFVRAAKRIHPKIALWAPGASQPEDSADNPDFPAVGSETERNRATRLFTGILTARARELGVPVLSLLTHLVDAEDRSRREFLYDGCHISQRLMPEARRLLTETLGMALPPAD
ncbi:MAG TPA: SGNH/GDSL hydrolase family protein [Stellaceae bacterium]|nr:SGNH/GDSL hydrolase family protein [Stellaceae bacterium]